MIRRCWNNEIVSMTADAWEETLRQIKELEDRIEELEGQLQEATDYITELEYKHG